MKINLDLVGHHPSVDPIEIEVEAVPRIHETIHDTETDIAYRVIDVWYALKGKNEPIDIWVVAIKS